MSYRAAAMFLSMALIGALMVAAASSAGASTTGGNFFGTGHDMDFHCTFGSADECAYFKIVVDKARNGSTLPILALDQGSQVPTALSKIGEGPVTTVDPSNASLFNATAFVDASNNPKYSVIITASDSTCGGCDNTPAGESNINARAADFTTYFDHGGNIIALTGAENFSTYYNFLPLTGLTGAPVSPPFTVTSDGAALGITSAMANCCITHSSFKIPPSPFKTLETDSSGLAETIDCLGCRISGGGFTGSSCNSQCIFQVELRRCTSLHVGYDFFPAGIVVRWNVSQNKVVVAHGQFTTLGGGKDYHFLTQPLGVALQPFPDGHVHFHWTINNVDFSYTAIRKPLDPRKSPAGCSLAE